MIAAIRSPMRTAAKACRKGILMSEATPEPVQTPVPGRGMPTKIAIDQNLSKVLCQILLSL